MAPDDPADFALAAYREEGRWEVVALPPRAAKGLEHLVAALRQLPAEGGALGLVSVADDFVVVVRVGAREPLLLLSDASAATEWDLAREVLEELGLAPDAEDPDDLDDLDEEPAGDLAMLADLGLPERELEMILDDLDLYPDEVLGRIASRLGFPAQFETALAAVRR